VAAALIAVGIFWWPAGVVAHAFFDRGTKGDGIPIAAWALHRSLSPRMEKWAADRLASGVAARLSTSDISGTEWPLFGNAFYLMALENLQSEWEKKRGPGKEPRVLAKAAIEAAAKIVADPNHAHWVKEHWGDKYLKHHNLFYRMLLISSFAAHERLLGTGEYVPFLRDQVESLSAELDAAPSGLLNDYPGQCYHVDIAFAVRAIRHADLVLGTDHSAFVQRELRAYPPGVLPPYFADQTTGESRSPVRGCSTSPFLIHAAALWPEHVEQWEQLHNRDFWQSRWWAVGYREFSYEYTAAHGMGESYFDVDSGPVIFGFGSAASAFGIGSSRANGDSSRARALTLQALAVSWPLPGGGLFLPRLVSDKVHAPLLGECALLYTLTQPALRPLHSSSVAIVPGMVWIIVLIQFALGLLCALCAIRWWRRAARIA
jgi:hypothetical protein